MRWELARGEGLGYSQGRLVERRLLGRVSEDKPEAPGQRPEDRAGGLLELQDLLSAVPLAPVVCFCVSFGDDRFCDQGLQLFIRGHPRAGGSHSLQRLRGPD